MFGGSSEPAQTRRGQRLLFTVIDAEHFDLFGIDLKDDSMRLVDQLVKLYLKLRLFRYMGTPVR